MKKVTNVPPTRNLHVPLPQPLYQRLRTEAKRTSRPATALAREAIDLWLIERHRAAVHEEIAAYAEDAAGTTHDLDKDMEAAGIERLLQAGKKTRKDKRR